MKNKEFTAEEYRKAIIELVEGISDVKFLRHIYSLIVGWKRKRAGV